ncbi:MAG: GNAT family N-acetyltransferase, partial [Armatimonadota bacterium]
PPVSAVSVRVATLADAARIGELANQWGYSVTPAQVAETLKRPTSGLAVFELDGEILGWIETREAYSMGGGDQPEITGLIVDQTLRRTGAGRALVDWAKQWAKSKGYTSLSVRSRTTREEAHAFYPAVGFKVLKQQSVFKMDLDE